MASTSKLKLFSGLFIFKIQSMEFCLDLKEIISVLKIAECKIHLKNSDPELEHGGSTYKIVSFDKIYNLSYKESLKTRIILIKIKNNQVGFFADEILEILAVDENSNKISRLSSANNPFIKWVIKYGGREIIMPDFEYILPLFR